MSKQTGFAHGFYRSMAWRNCREAYAKSRAGLCERCLAVGLYTPGTQVHHKQRLTPETLSNTDIALSWDNLELLCDACHHEEHAARQPKKQRRYRVDEDGTLRL